MKSLSVLNMGAKSKRYIILFVIVLFLSLFVKSFGLDYALYDDEANYAFAGANAYGVGFNPGHYAGMLIHWVYGSFVGLFGTDITVYRLVPLIFSTLTILLVFYFSKKLYGVKAAFLASLIMITSFWHNLASLQVDIDGSLMTFFYLICVMLYLYSKEKKQLWATSLFGLTLGLATLIKQSGIFIFAIIFIYDLFVSKSLTKTIKQLFVPFFIGGIIGFISLLLTYFLEPLIFSKMLHHGGSRMHFGFSFLALSMLIFWATPYLLGLFTFSVAEKKVREEKSSWLFIIWVLVILFIDLFIISRGDYSKYPMSIIPPIAILGGLFLSKIKINRREIVFTSILGGVFFLFTYLLNTKKLEVVPRMMELYLNHMKNFDFNFLFSYTGPSGPLFGISMLSFVLMLVISTWLVLCYFLNYKKTSIKKVVILFFLAITVGFNIFLIGQYVFNITSPDMTDVQESMIDYFYEENMAYPVFSNNEGILFLLDHSYELSDQIDNKTVGLSDFELEANIVHALGVLKQKKKGTLLLFNWPQLPESSPIREFAKHCELENTFVSKGYARGEIYSCSYDEK